MPEITCSATKCVYNEEGYCEKENIKIDIQDCTSEDCLTCCDSFSDQESCKGSCCKNSVSDSSEVECLATNCIYNSNRYCSADAIAVEGHGADCCEETYCDTYRKDR